MNSTRVHIFIKPSPLQRAVSRFNEFAGYDLRLPMEAKDVGTAALLAELRGRHDIATELRLALQEATR